MRPEGQSLRGSWLPGVHALAMVALVAAGLAAGVSMKLSPADLLPSSGRFVVAGRFFARAFTPALTYEAAVVPDGAPSFAWKVLQAARCTVVFAVAALSLSLLFALPLSLLASSTFWEDGTGSSSGRRWLGRAIHVGTRSLIAVMRSVHELLWAVLFLAALGRSNLAAVVAIAIPYTGILAKVFAELIDESPREAAAALRAVGASQSQAIVLSLLPNAVPNMCAYSFYRFECALRSSAVLGFFGYPTLGYYLAASYENLHYGEVWTYLYTLVLMASGAELWSGLIRARLVE